MKPTRRLLTAQILLGGLINLLLTRRAAHAETIDYTYDELGRLTRAEYEDGCVIDYSYDAPGNRTQLEQDACAPPPPPPPPPPPGFNATIAVTGSAPVNLRTLANAAGYNGAEDATIVFQVGSSVTIAGAAGGTTSSGGVGIDTGAWPSSSYDIDLTLEVSGKIYGGGGQGGKGACPAAGAAGSNGGDALNCQEDIAVNVLSGGEIKAGGGGGGGGGGRWYTLDPPFDKVGGGGGGGFPNGGGGAIGNPGQDGSTIGANPGAAGTSSGGGAGGSGETSGGGAGGAGGGAGSSGVAGSVGSGPGNSRARGVGGAAGYAIRKNGNTVAVTNNGAIVGAAA